MKKYFAIPLLLSIALLGASCNLFAKPTAGVMKTANGGVDWQFSNKLKNAQTGIDGLSISRLAHDPQSSEIIYASAFNGGLYVSRDGGGTWEQLLGAVPLVDFAVSPIDSQTIYVGGLYDEHGRVLATRDGGKSWNEVFTEGVKGSAVRAVAVNPSNPQQVLIGLASGGLIISNDGGASWRLVQNYNDRINRIMWRSEAIYVVVKSTGVFKSIDGANSFQQITASMQPSGDASGVAIFGNEITGFNQLAISESNPNVMYVTTAIGLYRSINGGSSWAFVNMPLRQRELAPTSVAIAPMSDSVVYVGAGSTIYKTVNAGSDWVITDTGTKNTINALLVSRELPQVAYAGVYIK